MQKKWIKEKENNQKTLQRFNAFDLKKKNRKEG